MNLMNTKKTAAGGSTAAVLTALTAVIVFLNFYFAIYDMHFFELFLQFFPLTACPSVISL